MAGIRVEVRVRAGHLRGRCVFRMLMIASGVCALAAVPGCGGPKGPDRYPVTGNVFREDQPVDIGNIQFIPTAGGPAASTQIKDGVYQFTKENGPVAGAQSVIIQQALPRGEVPEGTPKKDADFLPETRFKKQQPQGGWKMEITIDAGQNFTDPVDFNVDEATASGSGGGARKDKP